MSEILRKAIRKILQESLIVPPQIPGTMNFWHGGNLDEYNDSIAHRAGRYEYGAGLYLTSKYEVVKKYAKGSRKLYLITVQEGVDVNDAYLDLEKVKEFINYFVIGSKRKKLLQYLSKYIENNKIPADIFNNFILNNKAIQSTKTKDLRDFLTKNGIDYEIVDNAFGWGEKMMVLYNMKKIVNIIQVKSGDKITQFDL